MEWKWVRDETAKCCRSWQCWTEAVVATVCTGYPALNNRSGSLTMTVGAKRYERVVLLFSPTGHRFTQISGFQPSTGCLDAKKKTGSRQLKFRGGGAKIANPHGERVDALYFNSSDIREAQRSETKETISREFEVEYTTRGWHWTCRWQSPLHCVKSVCLNKILLSMVIRPSMGESLQSFKLCRRILLPGGTILCQGSRFLR